MTWEIRHGHVLDRLREMPDESVHCVVTSPPYWGLRDYGLEPVEWPEVEFAPMAGLPVVHVPVMSSRLGLEPDVWAFVGHLVLVFREVRRVLRRDGTCWINMGDGYTSSGGRGTHGKTGQRADRRHTQERLIGRKNKSARSIVGNHVGLQGSFDGQIAAAEAKIIRESFPACDLKPKDLIGQPWRVAMALQSDGWFLRSDIIWHKPNPMPESVTDRPTKAHEYLFLMTKSAKYFYDAEAIRDPFADDRNGCDYKTPDGWDTGSGAHGSVHRNGRERGRPARERNRGGRTDGFTKPNAIDPSANGGRNKRDVWMIATEPFPEAHFATFPTRLVEPCIKAGTSERGVCPVCGASWVREVEKSGERDCHGGNKKSAVLMLNRRSEKSLASSVMADGKVLIYSTTGWRPTCRCGADHPIPATVLDPFSGAGTTVMVALRLGRDGIGLEASEKYCEMSRRRIEDDAPLFNMAAALAEI
ncbi:MAG: site-specific DNA-methyltransferase [Bryobacteraceae bacterium]